MNDLISEFFYEGIRRIIPGLVVIALYYHKEVVKVLDAHLDAHQYMSIVLFVCILTIAWLVGLVIEEVMSLAAEGGWRYLGLGKCFLKIRRCLWATKSESIEKRSEVKPASAQIPEILLLERKDRKRTSQLCFAVREMSRSLCLIFAFAYFLSPEPFSNIQRQTRFGIVGFFAFLFAWLWADIREKPSNDENDEATSTKHADK